MAEGKDPETEKVRWNQAHHGEVSGGPDGEGQGGAASTEAGAPSPGEQVPGGAGKSGADSPESLQKHPAVGPTRPGLDSELRRCKTPMPQAPGGDANPRPSLPFRARGTSSWETCTISFEMGRF